MNINNTYPWIWLGFDDIYVRYPEQSYWETLSQDDIPWAARLSVAGGTEFLRRPGQKLGRLDHETARQVDKMVLEQLVAEVGAQAILFVSPQQARGLQTAAQQMESPPEAITLDSRLMVNQKTISISERQADSQTDFYVFDWTQPNQGTIREFIKDQTLVYNHCPLPVLMTVKAYADCRAEILSYYHPETGIGASTATLQTPQFQTRTLPMGLGLVWAFGFGLNLWQWALTPRALPDGETWHLAFEPPNICRITAVDTNEQYEWILQEPIIDVCFYE